MDHLCPQNILRCLSRLFGEFTNSLEYNRIRHVVLCVLVFACLSIPTSKARSSDIVWLSYPEEGVELGQGFDLLANRKTPSVCVEFIPVEDPGLNTRFKISTLRSFSDVFSALDIRVSGAMDMSVFKANARLTFANDIKTTAQEQQFVVAARVERGAHHTAPTRPIKRGGIRLPADPYNSDDAKAHSVRFRKVFSENRSDWDFLTRCGHGFVSAIVSGVELNAVIDTSSTKSKELVKATGSAEVDVLGGLISGSASLDSNSEIVNALRTSKVTAFISGGEDYQLPVTIGELKKLIQELPKLTKDKPRPLKIAITPYSNLVPEGRRQLFGTAQSLQTLVYAYFFAKDANDRTSEIADSLDIMKADGKYLIPQETLLYEKSSVARNTMQELAEAIAQCRSSIESENRNASRAAGTTEKFPSIEELYLRYSAAERARANQYYKRVWAMLEDEGTSSETLTVSTSETLTVSKCVGGSIADEAVKRSIELFVFSLTAVPVELDLIDDSVVPRDLFHKNIVFLAKNADASETSKYVFETSRLLGRYAGCKAEAHSLTAIFHRAQSEGATINDIAELGAKLKEGCRTEYTREIANVSRLAASSVEEKPSPDLAARIVQEVLARDIYKKAFHLLLKSMCDAHIFFPICSYTYGSLVYSISMNVKLDDESYRRMARILGLSLEESVEGGLREGNKRVDVWPHYNGRCAPDQPPRHGGECL